MKSKWRIQKRNYLNCSIGAKGPPIRQDRVTMSCFQPELSMLKNSQLRLIAFILAGFTGCSMHRAMPGPPPPPPPETILESADLQSSLFKGDQAVISDQDIARILNTQVNLAGRHRLAILNLGTRNSWSDELAEVEAKNSDNLLRTFKASPQFADALFLPSLLVPEKRTVPYLREASARIQADLLFVYNARIETFRRDRFFKSDEVHAQSIAESVLLDVRTGIVVDTAHASENISMKKPAADLNFSETVARAESEARGKAVITLANAVVQRLREETK